ncbi:MAG: CAP domain-containing protein [Turicibacter sp.]|nr:CAP domain-containing protein [Turicibacter sp.]
MTVSDFESRIFELVNIERAAAGIPLLVWNDDLARAARIHSEDMDRNNFTGHTGSDGSSLADRVARVGLGAAWNGLGENVARGQATPEAAMDSWLNSPGHRENILNPSYTQFGAGRSGNATTQKFMSTW